MNRHERRAAKARTAPNRIERAEYLDLALRALAGSADTATGATLITPDGEVSYISRADADAWVAADAPGVKQ